MMLVAFAGGWDAAVRAHREVHVVVLLYGRVDAGRGSAPTMGQTTAPTGPPMATPT